MNDYKQDINNFLIESLNNILRYEEHYPDAKPEDITLREMHVIEVVGTCRDGGDPARASDIADKLHIVPGTLTIMVKILERKGYLVRLADKNDRRSVRIALTELGIKAKEQHEAYHAKFVDEILSTMSVSEARIMNNALKKVYSILKKKNLDLKHHGVKIVTDSACDITPDEAILLNITIVPMSIVLNDTLYHQNVDITPSEFYTKLKESNSLPATVQLNPFDLEQVYRKATKGGNEVVAIHLASALSGTYQSAVIAAKTVKGVYPVDSQSSTIGTALLVKAAVKLRDEGRSAKEIAEFISELAKHVRLIACVDSLKYLVRGGTVSANTELTYEIPNVKSVISVVDSAVVSICKAKGIKAVCRELCKCIRRDIIDTQWGVTYGYSDNPEYIAEIKTATESLMSGCAKSEYVIGPIIGAHVGPGAAAVAYIAK
jgi:DegV family protein with EDD domain